MAQTQATTALAQVEIEGTPDIEIIPGTETLTDIDGARFVHGGRSNVVLVPRPSSDLHDPLNWKPFWKYITLINAGFYMFLGNLCSLSIAPMTPVLMQYFNTSISKIALLTGTTILTLGYANFIIIPCMRFFGRRPVGLICAAVIMVASIWSAVATSYNSLMGARTIVGFGAATSESFMPVIIADMMFLHERGTWMAIYFWVFFMGAWVGPIVSGNVADYVGWRWFFSISAILQGVNIIGMVIFLPETKYARAGTGHPRGISTDEEEAGLANAKDPASILADIKTEPSAQYREAAGHVSCVGRGRPTTLQRWGVNLKVDTSQVKFLPRDFFTPIRIACYPIILFAACCVGFGANCLLVLNLLESPAFSAPPYNFSPASVGFVNFALMVGGIFGLILGGPFSDWVSMTLTRRNGGIREPEMRLMAMVPFLVIGLLGLLVAGLGWEHKWAWPVIVVVGFGCTGVLVIAIPTIGLTYAVDSYKSVAGEILVVATVVKNTFGFGMTYYINDMANTRGYLAPIMLLAGLGVGIPVVGGVALWFTGKAMRKLTKNSKVHTY